MATSKRDRQRINREQRKAEEAKVARRARAIRLLKRSGYVAAALILAGMLISFLQNRGGDEATTTTTTTTSTTLATTTTTTTPPEAGPTSYEEIRALPTACGGDQPPEPTEMTFAEPGDAGVGDTPTAVIATSCGDLTVELDPAGAPETVNSFAFLAGEGYFDGTALHRIMSGFMMQGGDPTGTGTGGPGYTIPDELPTADDFVYTRGTVAMANAGSGTTGSQFFIVFDDTPLPPNYSVLGAVVDGFDVLDAIEEVPVALSDTGELSSPLQAVYIESVTVQ
jgi:peptidyl-prolyl cis-trans isomerase B (cyclophilin B)